MKNNKILLMITVLTLVVWSCSKEDKKQTETKAVEVKVATSNYLNIPKENRFSGVVIADDKLTLSTKVFGQIEAVLVKEGEKIKKGQLLLKIKNNDLVAKLNTARTGLDAAKLNLENTTKNYDRINSLYNEGSATLKELEDISVAKEVAVASFKEAQHKATEIQDYISYANLLSPINGFVSKKMVNEGDMANPGQPIMMLESMEELKVEINVPAFEISQFEINDSVKVVIDEIEKKMVLGSVEQIVPSSSYTGQFKVIVVLNQTNNKVKPGMYAKANLLKGVEQKLLLPKESIIHKGQLTGIYTVNQQNEAMLRWVRLGNEYGELIEIISGLTINENVIISASSKITDGVKVTFDKN